MTNLTIKTFGNLIDSFLKAIQKPISLYCNCLKHVRYYNILFIHLNKFPFYALYYNKPKLNFSNVPTTSIKQTGKPIIPAYPHILALIILFF